MTGVTTVRSITAGGGTSCVPLRPASAELANPTNNTTANRRPDNIGAFVLISGRTLDSAPPQTIIFSINLTQFSRNLNESCRNPSVLIDFSTVIGTPFLGSHHHPERWNHFLPHSLCPHSPYRRGLQHRGPRVRGQSLCRSQGGRHREYRDP